jgi:hypothetical protein
MVWEGKDRVDRRAVDETMEEAALEEKGRRARAKEAIVRV